MPRPTPFRALLIDFDGVIRRWPASEANLETRYGLPAGAIRSVAFAPALLLPAITGEVSDESWRAGVSACARICLKASTVYGTSCGHRSAQDHLKTHQSRLSTGNESAKAMADGTLRSVHRRY
jgi:hypothetical protein